MAIEVPKPLDPSGPCREKAQTIVKTMVKQHARELAGWHYLDRVLQSDPPEDDEEAALWEILGRARRERY